MASKGSARTLASSRKTPRISQPAPSRRRTSSVRWRGLTSQACPTPCADRDERTKRRPDPKPGARRGRRRPRVRRRLRQPPRPRRPGLGAQDGIGLRAHEQVRLATDLQAGRVGRLDGEGDGAELRADGRAQTTLRPMHQGARDRQRRTMQPRRFGAENRIRLARAHGCSCLPQRCRPQHRSDLQRPTSASQAASSERSPEVASPRTVGSERALDAAACVLRRTGHATRRSPCCGPYCVSTCLRS